MYVNNLQSDEAKKKAAITRANNLKQIAELDDQETDIILDYKTKTFMIYTNKATMVNRLSRAGYTAEKEDKVDGEVYSRTYRFGFEMLGKFMRTGIFG